MVGWGTDDEKRLVHQGVVLAKTTLFNDMGDMNISYRPRAMIQKFNFAGKALDTNMRKPVRDCSLLRVLEQSRLIMDLFKQRRTSSIKARKMAYYRGGGGRCI